MICASMRRPRPPAVHLLRRLPPSTGPIGTSGEIRYSLSADVAPRGHFKRCERTVSECSTMSGATLELFID